MLSATSVLADSLRRVTRGLPSTFWFLWAGSLINRLGSFVVPFLAIYLTDQRHLSTGEAGSIVAVFGLGALLSSPTGGYFADRVGRRATLLFGLFTSSAAMLTLGFLREPALIAVVTFVVGFTTELIRPAVSATVADVVGPEHRLTAFTALYWAANLGFSVAPVIAGFMATRSFTALFVADAATTFLYALLVLWKVPETKPESDIPAAAAPDGVRPSLPGFVRRTWERLGYQEIVRDGVFVSFCALSFLLAVLFFQHNSTLALEIRRELGPQGFGAIIAVNGILICLVQPFVARTLTRFRRSHVLAVSAVLVGFGFGLNAWAHTAPLYVLGVVVWTLGEIASSPVASALVADLSPTHARGRYQAVFSMCWGLAFFAGPLAGSFVMEKLGARTLWLSCVGLCGLIAAGHMAIAAPRRRWMESLRAAGLTATGGSGE
ncbi:MAG: MFS transporter [Myxococcaceae bacterium]|nr:MFS transporter [Myxococcaceae bacterium]